MFLVEGGVCKSSKLCREGKVTEREERVFIIYEKSSKQVIAQGPITRRDQGTRRGIVEFFTGWMFLRSHNDMAGYF